MNKLLAIGLGVGLLGAAGTALAERVYVKARGEVNLAPFKCQAIGRSPNVKRICYDEANHYVLVSLKGIWYHYCAVPPATISAWKQASSKGRFYNDNVREKFDCTVVSAPAYN